MAQRDLIPFHQWTNADGEVLLVKVVNPDGTSHGGFVWPASGEVVASDWSPAPVCGGGLHGWPWGYGISDGKSVSAHGLWIVFAAKPDDIVLVESGQEAKARCGRVVYCGNMAEAMLLTMDERIKCIAHNSRGSASSSGEGGSASSSGEGGSASSSGEGGSASSSGYGGSASSSGEGGFAFSSWRAKAGPTGAFVIRWHDGSRYRFAFGAVGEDGIEAGVWYIVRDGKLQRQYTPRQEATCDN